MPVVPEHSKVKPPVGPPKTVKVRLHRKKDVTAPKSLPPTDVMFENGRAFHNALGQGAVEHEKAHAQDPETVVALRQGKDQVEWIADEAFSVVRIRRHDHAADLADSHSAPASAADNPFDWALPRSSLTPNNRISSGVPRLDSELGRYKVTFKVGNELVDPDVEICAP